MKNDESIKDIRNYLNEPFMTYLYIKALETEDIGELKKLLIKAKSLINTYVDDANFYLRAIQELKKNDLKTIK